MQPQTFSTYEKLLETDIKIQEELLYQYKKELADAEAGTGLCAGMTEVHRRGIASTLREHITSCELAISSYRIQLEEEHKKNA